MTSGDWRDADPEIVEIASEMCELLARVVAEIAPRGIAEWGSVAFEESDGPNAEFLVALADWEADQSEANTSRLREAFNGVVATWVEIRIRYDYPHETPQ